MNDDKLSYEAPAVKEYGTIADLTAAADCGTEVDGVVYTIPDPPPGVPHTLMGCYS